MIAQKSPTISKAIAVLKELSNDEKTMLLYEEREKIRRDEQSKLAYSFNKGKEEVAISLLKLGVDKDTISEATGFSYEQLDNLQSK